MSESQDSSSSSSVMLVAGIGILVSLVAAGGYVWYNWDELSATSPAPVASVDAATGPAAGTTDSTTTTATDSSTTTTAKTEDDAKKKAADKKKADADKKKADADKKKADADKKKADAEKAAKEKAAKNLPVVPPGGWDVVREGKLAAGVTVCHKVTGGGQVCLDNHTDERIGLYAGALNGGARQRWNFNPNKKHGWGTIESAPEKGVTCLDSDGQRVYRHVCNGGPFQKWALLRHKSGVHMLQHSQGGRRCINAAIDKPTSSWRLQLGACKPFEDKDGAGWRLSAK